MELSGSLGVVGLKDGEVGPLVSDQQLEFALELFEVHGPGLAAL